MLFFFSNLLKTLIFYSARQSKKARLKLHFLFKSQNELSPLSTNLDFEETVTIQLKLISFCSQATESRTRIGRRVNTVMSFRQMAHRFPAT